MSTEQNKVSVRRFVTEVLTGRNLGLADEVLAPNYVNRLTGGDLAAFKGFLSGMSAALSDVQIEIDELVAERGFYAVSPTGGGGSCGMIL